MIPGSSRIFREEVSNIEFKLAADSDGTAIATFLADRRRRRMTSEEWRWEFMRFPQLAVFTLATDDGRVVGTQAMLPIYLNGNGDVFLTSKSEASYLDPGYRGKGVFEALYRFAEERCAERGHNVIWGFTSAARVWKESLKFDLVTPCMYELSLNLGIKYRLLSFAAELASVARTALESGSRAPGLEGSAPRGISVESALKTEADMAALYESVRRNHEIHFHLEMDSSYVNWRIHNNPNLKYIMEYLYESDELIGYYVYSMDGGIAKISDVVYKDSGRAGTCLKALVASVVSRNGSSIYYFGNADSALNGLTFRVLEAWGGVKARSGWANFVLKRNLNCPAEELYDTSGWHLNGLWTEGVTL